MIHTDISVTPKLTWSYKVTSMEWITVESCDVLMISDVSLKIIITKSTCSITTKLTNVIKLFWLPRVCFKTVDSFTWFVREDYIDLLDQEFSPLTKVWDFSSTQIVSSALTDNRKASIKHLRIWWVFLTFTL